MFSKKAIGIVLLPTSKEHQGAAIPLQTYQGSKNRGKNT